MSKERDAGDLANAGSLFPTFHVRVGDGLRPGLVTCGNFLGKGPCLAFTSGSGLVTIYGMVEEGQGASRITINVKQSIVALGKSRPLDATDSREGLVVGHTQALQCYDVCQNHQLFYTEVESTVECILSVPAASQHSTMVIVGGQCTIQGFNLTGKEILWAMTTDKVSSLAIIQTVGRTSLLVGSSNFEIFAIEIDDSTKRWVVQEADIVEFLVDLGENRYGYGLKNGTIGVYKEAARIWRVKSKHKVQCLSAISINNQLVLFTGWSNGKFEGRKILNGDIVCRESVSDSVVMICFADFRRCEMDDILACTARGFLRGYNTTISQKAKITQDIAIKENTLSQLNQKLKELMFELETLEVARHRLGNEAELNALQHAEAEMREAISVKLESCPQSRQVSLRVDSSRSEYPLKGVIVLGENLFDNESDLVILNTPQQTIRLQLSPQNDVATEVCLQVLVKHRLSSNYQVIEVYHKIPKFLLCVPLSDKSLGKSILSYVVVVVKESFLKLKQWKNDRFQDLVDEENENAMSFAFLYARSALPVELTIEGSEQTSRDGIKITLKSDDIELLGALVQDICLYFELTDLQPLVHFPNIIHDLQSKLEKLQQYDFNGLEFSSCLAKTLPHIKTLMVTSEDNRQLRDMSSLRMCLKEIYGLNQDLLCNYERKLHNKETHIQLLQGISKQIQQVANLFCGKFKNKILQDCRQCLKQRQINCILELIDRLQHYPTITNSSE